MFGDECRRTLAYQLESISELDAKSIAMFRTSIILGALLIAALSVLAETRPGTLHAVANWYTGVGLVALLVSSAVALLAHSASRVQTGVHPQHAFDVTTNEFTSRELESGLVVGYADWLQQNQRINMKKAALLTVSMIVLVAALVHLSLGLYAAVIDWYTPILALGGWVGLGLFAAASDLVGLFRRCGVFR